MAIDTFQTARRIRNLETRLRQMSSRLGNMHDDPEFLSWASEAEAMLAAALPGQSKLHAAFEEAAARETVEISKLLELLKNARSLLFIETNPEADKSLADEIELQLNKLMMKSPIFRWPAYLLGFATLLFLGATWEVHGYKLDIDAEARKIRSDIQSTGTSFKQEMQIERDRLLRAVESVDEKINAEIQNARAEAKARLDDWEKDIASQRQRLADEVDRQIGSAIPARVELEGNRIAKVVDTAIADNVPRYLAQAFESISTAAAKAIETDLPPKVASEFERVTLAATEAIETDLPKHLEGERQRLSNTTDNYLAVDLPQHLAHEQQSLSQEFERLISEHLPSELERARQRISEAAQVFVNGPLREQLEAERTRISAITDEWISGALAAHTDLEKTRLTAEADRLRRTMWVGLSAKLSQLLLEEFRNHAGDIEAAVTPTETAPGAPDDIVQSGPDTTANP